MVIDARAPLEKMFGYSTAVRSLSQGRAGYTMEPLEYAAAPDSLLEAIAGIVNKGLYLEGKNSWQPRPFQQTAPVSSPSSSRGEPVSGASG